MGKKFFVGCLILVLAAAIFSAEGCKKKKEEMGAFAPPPGESKGDLSVVSATPQGPTDHPSESQTIVVIFDHPMVPLEALPDGKGSSFLKISPPASGKHRWLGTKALTFTPDARFPYSTEVQVTVPAGVKSHDGYTLARDFSWSFRTIRPQLVQHFPQNGQKSLKLDTRVLLIFNQPIARAKAPEFISFRSLDPRSNQEVSLDFSLGAVEEKLLKEENIEAPPENVLLLDPKDLLKPDFVYKLDVRKGIPGNEGPLGSEEDSTFWFQPYLTFRFERLNITEPHSPHQPLKFQFSNPVSYKTFIQKFKIDPEVAIPDYYSEWDSSNSTIWFDLPLEAETAYSVRIAGDLEDIFGNKLGDEIKLQFTTAPFPPSISMTTGYGVVEAYGDLRYPFFATNMSQVFLHAANVRKDDVVGLLANDRIFWSNEKAKVRGGFFQWEKPLEFKVPKNKSQIVPIELERYLTDRHGFLFLQLSTGLQDAWDRYPKVFLQATDLGISAKFSAENNLIWVTELKTGLPVPDAEVEVRDDTNAVRWRGKTDVGGKAESPGWRELGITSKDEWSKPRQWVFARRAEDIAFTSSEWGTGIYPYRFGIDYDWNPRPVTSDAYLFTERGIYRAGETVHVKGIVRKREKGKWELPSADKIECEVRDSFEKSVFKKQIPMDLFGSFDFDVETAVDASLGYYQIQAVLPPEKEGEKPATFHGTFRVEAFRPAEFEVLLRSLSQSYVFKEDYKAEIRASYLSGGGMAGQKAAWTLRLNPAGYSPPGYKGYSFGSELEWGYESEGYEGSRLLSSGEGVLGPEGKLEMAATLVPEKETDSVMATLEATVVSPSRRSISSRIQTLVHRGEYYIGLRPGTTFLEQGKDLSLNVITVDPQGKAVPGKDVSLKLVKREWRSVRQAGVGGRYSWHTEKEDIEVSSQTPSTKNEPLSLSFKPEKSGYYFFKAEGKDSRNNTITTTAYFYVTGRDYVAWEQKDDDTLELVADSEEYKPGETAKILVKSPYEKAKALVTVEREFVLESRILDIEGSTSQVAIPIGPDYIPNVFVSVLLVQGRSSSETPDQKSDVGKPSFKMGYVELAVNPFEKRLSVEVDSDKKEYKPKDRVTLNLKVLGAKEQGTKSSVSLAVVDVGVLNLIGYQTPDPFQKFYAATPLSVQTSEMRIHIVGERDYGEKGEDVAGGGDKGVAAPMSLAEVELRGDFKTTAYWNASLITDNEGKATVSFDLPSNLTTFRIMAVAQTQDSGFGQAESTFRVSKPLQLRASLPRFARVGDKFQGGVVVHNISSKRGEATLSLEADGILCSDPGVRKFTLETGEAREVLFTFEASKPGTARFGFRALMGGESDGLEVKIPVNLPRPAETVAVFDEVRDKKAEQVRIPKNAYLEESRIDVEASASALSGLRGGLDYLTRYPYLCLEQRVSAILPYLVASKVIFDFRLNPLGLEETRAFVRTNLEEIANYQKANGGFGLWPDYTPVSPYATAYAVFAMLKAKEAGYEVNQDSLDQALIYLAGLLRQTEVASGCPYSLAGWKTTQAFALYDLALAGRPEPAFAERLFTQRKDLTLFGRTLLIKSLYLGKGSPRARTALFTELMNMIKVEPTKAHFEEEEEPFLRWIYTSNLRTTALILQMIIETGADHPLLPQIVRWLVEERKTGHWHSTQENFFVFYALNEFFGKFEREVPDFRFRITLGDKKILEDAFVKVRNEIKTATLSLMGFKPDELVPLEAAKDGQGTLYYSTRMTYAPKEKLDARDEGIAVVKRIESPSGKPLASIKAGSLVVVTLDIVVPQERLFVVVNDPLPAGFEAVNPTFVTESQEEERALEAMGEADEDYWREGFNHVEMHDNRVLLFADSLGAGVHTHRYLARALTFGSFLIPGTKAEEMYAPEVFGRSPEVLVKIEK